jgi:hypothetical protein
LRHQSTAVASMPYEYQHATPPIPFGAGRMSLAPTLGRCRGSTCSQIHSRTLGIGDVLWMAWRYEHLLTIISLCCITLSLFVSERLTINIDLFPWLNIAESDDLHP